MSPYKKLWAAVMGRAVDDLKKKKTPGAIKDQRISRDSAIHWFKNRQRDDVGSFIWVCRVLDIDPDYARAVVLNRYGV